MNSFRIQLVIMRSKQVTFKKATLVYVTVVRDSEHKGLFQNAAGVSSNWEFTV